MRGCIETALYRINKSWILKDAIGVTCHKPSEAPARNNPSLWYRPKSDNRHNWPENSHWHIRRAPKCKVIVNFISNHNNPKISCCPRNLFINISKTNSYSNERYIFLSIILLKNQVLYFLQMLVTEDISAWIARVYDDNGDCILICKGFNSIKIHFPTLFRKKIIMASFKVVVTPCCMNFI